MWEVRVALGPDPVSGGSQRRSLTVHGDQEVAVTARHRCAEQAGLLRARRSYRPGLSLADLLATWLAADHRWRPSTLSGYRSVVKFLTGDPLAGRRAVQVSAVALRAACASWRQEGWPEPTIAARVRCLRSALRWPYAEQILDCDPLDGMRGPPQPGVRMHAPVEAVRDLIALAEADAAAAAATTLYGTAAAAARLHRAEQVLLLVRLAADSGARRGELAALRLEDLDGDVLTIARGTSCEVVGPTKTSRIRRLTLGAGTARLWRSTVRTWRDRAAASTGADGSSGFGPWLLSPTPIIRPG